MVHRLALFFGAIGAAGVLALAMNLGGLFSAAPVASDSPAAGQSATSDPTKTVIDKVYVAPTPRTSHVTRPTRPNTRDGRPGGDRADGGD